LPLPRPWVHNCFEGMRACEKHLCRGKLCSMSEGRRAAALPRLGLQMCFRWCACGCASAAAGAGVPINSADRHRIGPCALCAPCVQSCLQASSVFQVAQPRTEEACGGRRCRQVDRSWTAKGAKQQTGAYASQSVHTIRGTPWKDIGCPAHRPAPTGPIPPNACTSML